MLDGVTLSTSGMSNKERVRPNNQNFDLDDYLREKSELDSESLEDASKDEGIKKRKYGFWLIFIAIVAIYLMNPLGQYERFFGEGENELTEVPAPVIPAPVVPIQQSSQAADDQQEQSMEAFDISGSFLDYATALRSFEITDNLSVSNAQALFDRNIPLGYINILEESDLFDDLSAAGIISIFDNNIPAQYLNELGASDLF